MIAFTEESQFQLVETLAERLVEIIMNDFNVPWCRLKLSRLGEVTGSRSVGVIIERGQR